MVTWLNVRDSENDQMSDFFIFAYSYSIRGYLPYVNVTKLDVMLKFSFFDVLDIISSLTKWGAALSDMKGQFAAQLSDYLVR